MAISNTKRSAGARGSRKRGLGISLRNKGEGTMIWLNGVSLTTLAKRFPTEPPPSVLKAFKEALGAVDLDPKKFKLKYVSSEAVRSIEDDTFKIGVGKMGIALTKTAYVVQSDNGGIATEREVAVHEAMHFKFGPHPWPGEIGYEAKQLGGE